MSRRLLIGVYLVNKALERQSFGTLYEEENVYIFESAGGRSKRVDPEELKGQRIVKYDGFGEPFKRGRVTVLPQRNCYLNILAQESVDQTILAAADAARRSA